MTPKFPLTHVYGAGDSFLKNYSHFSDGYTAQIDEERKKYHDLNHQKESVQTTSALLPKFAVGQQLPHGVIGEGSDPGSRVYTVKTHGRARTISLATFCEETGYSYDQVMALNKLSSFDALKIPNGKVLKLPTTSGPVPSPNHKPVVDIEKATAALDKNTAFDMHGNPKSEAKGVGYCSHYVFKAINAGLPKDKPIIGPGLAKNAGPALLKAGFRKVLNSSDQLGTYTPRKGDVVVLQNYPKQPYKAGHIAMYDGKNWVSDFQQTGIHHIWAGTHYEANKVGMVVYRP